MQKIPKLGVLVCGHTPDQLAHQHGSYGPMFARLLGEDAFIYTAYNVVDGEFPTSVADADAWLITGSRHGVYEDHAWIPPLEQFIRSAYADQIPMVGICFGHQILAQALGGKVEKFSAGRVVGRVEYTFDGRMGATKAALHAWHQDQVVELPPDAAVIGSSDNCQFAALVYGSNVLSLQPHPEFSDEFLGDLLAAQGHTLPSDTAMTASQSLGKPLSRPVIAAAMRRFLQGNFDSNSANGAI